MLRARTERGCCHNLSQRIREDYRATLLTVALCLLLLATSCYNILCLHNQNEKLPDNRRLCEDGTDILANVLCIATLPGISITFLGIWYAFDPEGTGINHSGFLQWGLILLVMVVSFLVIKRTSNRDWSWLSSLFLIGGLVSAKIAIDHCAETIVETEFHTETAVLGIASCMMMGIFILWQIVSHLTVMKDMKNPWGEYVGVNWKDRSMVPYVTFILGMVVPGSLLFYNLADNGNTFDEISVNVLETCLSVFSTLLLVYTVYGAYHRGKAHEIKFNYRNVLSKKGSIVIGTMIGLTGILITTSMWSTAEDVVWNTCQNILLPLCVCGLMVSILIALYGRLFVNDKFVLPWQFAGGYVGNVLLATGVVSTVGGTCAVMENILGDNGPDEISAWWFVASGLSLLAGIIYRALEGRGDFNRYLRPVGFWPWQLVALWENCRPAAADVNNGANEI